jgi:hypothetical protein
MNLFVTADELLDIATRYLETDDDTEIADILSRLTGVDEEQAIAIMRGSGNDLDPIEKLVALAVSSRIIDRAEGIRLLDDIGSRSTGARP